MLKTNFLFGENRKKRLLIDMDQVSFDFETALLNCWNKEHPQQVHILTEWDLTKAFPNNDFKRYFNTKGFYYNMPINKSFLEVFPKLYETYDARMVTTGPHHMFYEKTAAMLKYFDFFNPNHMIFTADKSSVWGDYLIDDKIENILDFDKIGESIIFNSNANRQPEVLKLKYKRVNDFYELAYYLENN